MKRVTPLHSDQMNVSASTSHNIETDRDYSTIDTPMSNESHQLKTRKSFAGENLWECDLNRLTSESSQMHMMPTEPHSTDYNKLEHQLGTQPLDVGCSTNQQGTVTIDQHATSPMKYHRMTSKSNLGDAALMQSTSKSQTELSQLSLPLNKGGWYGTYQQPQCNQELSCHEQTLATLGQEECGYIKQEKEISIPTLTVDQEPSDNSNQ